MRNCVNYGSVTHSGTAEWHVYIGGIVGYSYGSLPGKIYIQNCLNYGTIKSNGTSYSLHIGGITGDLFASNKDATVRNCANYGSVTHSGTVGSSACIGGIIGDSSESSPNKVSTMAQSITVKQHQMACTLEGF